MANDTVTDRKKGQNAATKTAAWVLMGLLIFGLGGFGVTSFGGGTAAIGSVGDQDITANDYARELQQQAQALSGRTGGQMTGQQAISLGLDRQVLAGLVTRAALDNEAARIGLSVGDRSVADEITSMQAFQGVDGTFDRETYRFALQRSNLSEADFEASLRRDVARSILQGAIGGGFAAPATLTDTLYTFVAERRGVSVLQVTEAMLTTPVPAPTEAEMKAHYDAHLAERFTRPEAKRITYAALLPDTIAAAQTVDEAQVKALYDSRLSQYVQPEWRLVERLVYPDDAAAAAAKAKLDAGTTFEALVAERGLTLDDIDLGDSSKAELGAAGDAVFALTEPGVVGPFASDLGPALFRMNAILTAQETSLDDAREELTAELRGDAARKFIADKFEAVDDLLAGGITLKDLAAEQGMDLQTIDFVPTATDHSGIDTYPEFRDAATKVVEGDFAEAIMLEDGGIVALQLDEIVPAAPIPFDEARPAVEADWRAEALAKALTARAEEIATAVTGGAALGGFGIVGRTAQLSREANLNEAPTGAAATAFTLAAGEARAIQGDGRTIVLRVDDIQPAATEGEDALALKDAIALQARQAIATDAFTAFSDALTAESGISLDQAAINAVNSQIQ